MSHNGLPGKPGPPGYPPIVGAFGWCWRCCNVLFVKNESYSSMDDVLDEPCPRCNAQMLHISNAWRPDGAVMVWLEDALV